MSNRKRLGHWLCCLVAMLALAVFLGGCAAAASTTDEAEPPLPTPIEREAQPSGDAERETAADEHAKPNEDADGEGAAPAEAAPSSDARQILSYRDVPAFEGSSYVYVNDGEPTFTDEQRAAEAGCECYGDLDELGRCTTAFAVVGPETQPTEKRGSIGEVRPSGWQMAKYDFVEGKYLFNRCHLLGYQLTGENANERNLITGTRYLNVQGMLPFENAVADYVDATGNHVLMAVTPVFEGSELVARGVHMMAESVEDDGEGVAFNVFCYNVQPGVVINYGTGESVAEESATPLPDVSGAEGAPGSAGQGAGGAAASTGKESAAGSTGDKAPRASSDSDGSKGLAEYVLNTNSKKFHAPSCSSVDQMSEKNRKDVEDTRENIIANGYEPCKRCNP